jgi:hypothetical protein
MVGTTVMSAVFSVGLGLLAWEFIMWQQETHISFLKRLVVTSYPLADLVVVSLMLRLIFAGGARSRAILLLLASVSCFVAADVGWAVILRNELRASDTVAHLLEMSSMGAYALMGGAAAYASVEEVVPDEPARARGVMWLTLAVSALTAPTLVIAVEALLDRLYTSAGR